LDEYIEYTKIKSFPKLFVDYITNFNKICEFYSENPFSEKSWEIILNLIKNRKYKRNIICNILKKQNKDSENDLKLLENINSLENENCFAVMTGQQPGILTGPLYTIYKAITAIKLSDFLKRKYNDYNFIPIFWMETNDHDFKEVNKINIIQKDKSLLSLTYKPEKEFENRPVGEITFDEKIGDLLKNFYELLSDNEFKSEIINLLTKSFQISTSIGTSFRMIMTHLFKGKGLILLDPSDPEFKKLAKDIFLKISENCEKLNENFSQTYHKLKEHNYQPEVIIKKNSLNLFYHKSGERHPLYINNDNIILKNNKFMFKKQELNEIITKSPELFSPNVLTRPIIQDFIFPTVSYVAGPTEICYFSQISDAYKLTEIPMPIIFPRSSITIIDKKISKIIKSLNIQPKELIENRNLLEEKLTEKYKSQELINLFQESETTFKIVHQKISSKAETFDITLKDGVEKSFKKIFYQLNKIEGKFNKIFQEKNSIIKKQTNEINNLILPNGKLQERNLNIFTFISKYGMSFIGFLFNEINIYSKKHQLIFLEKISDKQ
jgi:bacillithiol biosynthesis cysteine-adding enzyme BshC